MLHSPKQNFQKKVLLKSGQTPGINQLIDNSKRLWNEENQTLKDLETKKYYKLREDI